MRSYRLLFALILIVGVRSDAVAAENEIPRYFEHKLDWALLWLTLSEAITPEGTLRPDLRRHDTVSSEMRRHLDQELARKTAAGVKPTPDVCDVEYGHTFADGPDDGVITSSAALEELLETRSVISGTVTATDVGLHSGVPFTILQIDTNSEGAPAKRVFLLYPRGRARYGGLTYCNEDPEFKELPSIGDSILFVASYAVDATNTLFITNYVVYETKSGVVATAGGFRLEPDAQPRSVRGFMERLRAAQKHVKQQ